MGWLKTQAVSVTTCNMINRLCPLCTLYSKTVVDLSLGLNLTGLSNEVLWQLRTEITNVGCACRLWSSGSLYREVFWLYIKVSALYAGSIFMADTQVNREDNWLKCVTSWKRMFLKESVVAYLLKFPAFMELEGSWPCLQKLPLVSAFSPMNAMSTLELSKINVNALWVASCYSLCFWLTDDTGLHEGESSTVRVTRNVYSPLLDQQAPDNVWDSRRQVLTKLGITLVTPPLQDFNIVTARIDRGKTVLAKDGK